MVLAGCVNIAPQSRANPPTPTIIRGQQVFLNMGCFQSCHILGTVSTSQHGQTMRNPPVATPPDLSVTPSRSDDWLLAYFISPRDIQPYSPMASYSYLPEADLKALIAYLQSINTNPIPATLPLIDPAILPQVPADKATYQVGRTVYQNYCRGCHGEGGKGNGSVGHLLTPEPRDFTDAAWLSRQSEVYLFSAVSYGKPGTAMPAYNDVLTLEQRSQALNYIGYFADPVMKQRMELPSRVSSQSGFK